MFAAIGAMFVAFIGLTICYVAYRTMILPSIKATAKFFRKK